VSEYTCKYCGSPTNVDPSDQERPADYCDHPPLRDSEGHVVSEECVRCGHVIGPVAACDENWAERPSLCEQCFYEEQM
jgi:hypothetical protein